METPVLELCTGMDSGNLGRGGGYFRNFMTGVCGPNFEDTPYS